MPQGYPIASCDVTSLFSVALQPIQEGRVWFTASSSPNLDYVRAVEDKDYMLQFFHDVSKHPEIRVDKIVSIAEWKCVCG